MAVFPQHAALLAASAIAPEVAQQRGYRSADTKAQLERDGFSKVQRSIPGLLIPIHGVDGKVRLHQYRPDHPRMTDAGKVIKYETPFGRSLSLDIHPAVLPQLGDPSIPLWITEGARKVDAAVSVGLACIGLLGVYGWRTTNGAGGKVASPDWESIALNGREVYIAFDSDTATNADVQKALDRLSALLSSKGADVHRLQIPPGASGAKVGLDDYLAAGGTIQALIESVDRPDSEQPPPPPPPPQYSLAQTVAVFQRWLYFEDPTPLYVLAATLTANRAPGDPVWLLLVCAPSTGKTELLAAATRLPWVISAAVITEAALLSGTPSKEKARDATGGLLRQIGDFGVIVAKDFTSILAQNKDTSAQALAALREIYDGRWDRPTGADGGRVLTWKGKCGFIGGVTPAYDRYSQVVSQLGDRFVTLRMDDADVDAFGMAAINNLEREAEMRHELGEALAGLVEHANPELLHRQLSEDDKRQLIALAAYTARARTEVARDGYRQEILYLPQVEGPGRLVKIYRRLLGGLEAIGCTTPDAWQILERVAISSVPASRTSIIRDLLEREEPATTSEIARSVGVSTNTAQKYLEDLTLLKMAVRTKKGAKDNSPNLWEPSQWLRDYWPKTSSQEKYPPTPNPFKGVGDTTTTHTDAGKETPGTFPERLCCVCDKPNPDATYFGDPVHKTCAPNGKVDPL